MPNIVLRVCLEGQRTINKNPSRTTKNFDDSIIFNISEKELQSFAKPVLKKGLGFCIETGEYNKLKLMDNLFWFCRKLRLGEFFLRRLKQTTMPPTRYIIKYRKEQICPNNLKIAYFTLHKNSVINSSNIFHQQKTTLTFPTSNISITNKKNTVPENQQLKLTI